MSLTPIEMFNMFVDNHAGDHQAFTGWLGEYMGYPGTQQTFANEHSAYVTQFDPTLGLATAFQDYYNKTGVDLTQIPYEQQPNLLGGTQLTSMNSSVVMDQVNLNTDGSDGSIKEKFSASSAESRNDFDNAVETTSHKYGQEINAAKNIEGSASGGGVLKLGTQKRKIVDSKDEGMEVGSNLLSGLQITRDQALNEYNTDMSDALIGVKQTLNTEINNWYSNVMTGIESLAMEGVFDDA